MAWLRNLCVAVLVVLVLSCGGGGGGGSNSAGPEGSVAPTLTLTRTGTDQFSLMWSVPGSSPITGFSFEVKTGNADYQPMFNSHIPADVRTLNISFYPDALEDTTFLFRVRSIVSSGVFSPYSNEVNYARGMNGTGSPVAAYDWTQGGVALTWEQYSKVATELRVERVVTDDMGNLQGAWTPVATLPVTSVSHLDTTADLGTWYRYRIFNHRGTEDSPKRESYQVSTAIPAPSNLTYAYDFALKAIQVSWSRNLPSVEEVILERCATASRWETPTGPWTRVEVADPSLTTIVDSALEANRYYAYRISHRRGSNTSYVTSGYMSAFAGVPSVYYPSAYSSSQPWGIQVSWSQEGITPFQVRLERCALDVTNEPDGRWQLLTTVYGSAHNYLDAQVEEGKSYGYRITNLHAGIESLPVVCKNISPVPLRPPMNLEATALEGGIRLTWANQSLVAGEIVVLRAQGANSGQYPIARLSGTQTTYTDPNPKQGYYQYCVQAVLASQTANSNPVSARTFDPVDALKVDYKNSSLSGVADGILRPNGGWILGTSYPIGVRSENDPWPAWFPSDASSAFYPMVGVGQVGWPHLVYKRAGSDYNRSTLWHDRYDGQTWQSEAVLVDQQMESRSEMQDWKIAPDGGIHMVVPISVDTNSSSVLTYVHKVGGAWVQESLKDKLSTTNWPAAVRLDLDRQGLPMFLVNSWDRFDLLCRNADGTWTQEQVPTGPVSSSGLDFLGQQWVDAKNGWVFFERYAYSGMGFDSYFLMALQKKEGQWQSPIILGGRDFDGASTRAHSALSPDGSKLAIVLRSSRGFRVFDLDAKGWHETLLWAPTSNTTLLRAGYDQDQRLHILTTDKDGKLVEAVEAVPGR